jgi:hypothetical protein
MKRRKYKYYTANQASKQNEFLTAPFSLLLFHKDAKNGGLNMSSIFCFNTASLDRGHTIASRPFALQRNLGR